MQWSPFILRAVHRSCRAHGPVSFCGLGFRERCCTLVNYISTAPTRTQTSDSQGYGDAHQVPPQRVPVFPEGRRFGVLIAGARSKVQNYVLNFGSVLVLAAMSTILPLV